MTIELTLLTSVSHQGQEITAPRLRGLLALLAGELRAGRAAGRLVDGLWPDEQPENPAKALQILVSRARKQLGAEVIASTPTGYRLALREDQVDAGAVLLFAAASAEKTRAGDHAGALAEAEEGLALWDGATVGEAAPSAIPWPSCAPSEPSPAMCCPAPVPSPSPAPAAARRPRDPSSNWPTYSPTTRNCSLS